MPATPQDRLYGLTTSVAVKPPVYISADYEITRFGEQTITSKTPTDERTITTTEGMRVLLLGQDNPVENGIWVARRSFWVRATDFNGPRDAVNGTLVFSINGDCWQVEADDPVVIGKSVIHFRPTYPFEANLDIFQRTLRVPEASVSVLPSAEDRAWKGLGFDGAGQPKLQDPAGTGLWGYVPAIGSFEKGSLLTQRFEVLLWESTDEYWRWDGEMPKIVLPDSTPDTAGGRGKGKWLDVTDATLRSNLASSEGFGLVGQVESFAALRSVAPNAEGQSILLRAHPVGWAAMSHGPVGGGEFIARKGTAVDDGGYICVPTGQTEYYWQRIPKNPGKVCATEFGLNDGAALDDIWTSAINYCIKNSIGYLSTPSLGPAGYTLVGGLEFMNSTNGLIIEGPGMATKGVAPVITHTGDNIGLTFKRATQAQGLLNSVILKNLTVVGNALATAFVRFSDFYGGSVFDSVIRDYTTGTNIDFYNDVGWTESVRVDNVMSRTSKRGIWFHSNPDSTDYQTLSFFGAVIENFGFQHGIGGASYGITVGDGSRADNLYNCKIDMTGWWEQGGNSTALYVDDKAIVDGEATFRYDGFAASAMSSTTQPTRLIRKNGYAGYVKLNCKNYKHLAGIGLTAGVTSLTIRPWLALAESLANIATPHPTLPGEHIITAPGLKCKLTGNIIQGQDSIVQVRSLPAWHRYKVTLRSGLSSTAQQQYIVNTHSDNNAGTVTRTDSVSAATTTVEAGTSNYSTTLSNKNFNPIYLRNAGGLADGTYSESYRRGFDLVLNGTSALVTYALVPISMEIEAID